MLDINLEEIDTIVISHGHYDHFGGLMGLLKTSSRIKNIILHPDAFKQRRLNLPIRPDPIDMARLEKQPIESSGANLIISQSASLLGPGMMLTSGEVRRVTGFETDTPFTQIRDNGIWRTDQFKDDQGIALHLKDEGLVIVSGCAHSGIINIIKHFQKITGINKIHAVLGGFHLSGPAYEATIPPTINALKRISPKYLIPMHCTGWEAANQFAKEMPDQFILNTVGTTYAFQAECCRIRCQHKREIPDWQIGPAWRSGNQ